MPLKLQHWQAVPQPHPSSSSTSLKHVRKLARMIANAKVVLRDESDSRKGRADEQSTLALAEDAIVWASQHGLLVGLGAPGLPEEVSSVALVHAPVTVLPVRFPRPSFMKAKKAATVFNTLIDRVASDDDYLQNTLALAADHDEFLAKLLHIHRETAPLRETKRESELVLAINRSDYMLDEPSCTMLQVELNTIASSFGALSTLVARMHRYIYERSYKPAEVVSLLSSSKMGADRFYRHVTRELEHLPPNNVTIQISEALAAAVQAHGISDGRVMMVVHADEKNSFDQQWLQTTLWEHYGVRTIRRTLAQIAVSARLDSGGNLFMEDIPISVVYYRSGYSPDDYQSPATWKARQTMEESSAVQCPSVAYQLAGAKKIQQDLASPETLERFLDSTEEVELARSCFAGLWSLDNPEEASTREVVEDAIANPDAYVLKPQREGGGNNLYGKQLRQRLQNPAGLSAYILMQRIQPPIKAALMVRQGILSEVESLSELGIYGTFLRQGKTVLLNQEAGHLVRTKAATSDEGGVAAGYAVLDSPYLTD